MVYKFLKDTLNSIYENTRLFSLKGYTLKEVNKLEKLIPFSSTHSSRKKQIVFLFISDLSPPYKPFGYTAVQIYYLTVK